MNGSEGLSVADALALRNSGNDNDGFGDGNAWWIIILILLFAANGRGFGFDNGGNGGYGFGGWNPCCTPATLQGMTDAFNFNQLDNSLRGITNGICDGFYATSGHINGVTSTLQNGFGQVQLGLSQSTDAIQQAICGLGHQISDCCCATDKAIMQANFQNQAGFNAVTNQLASCCCEIGRGQDAIKYELARATNDLMVANDKNTDRIINHLTTSEMERLRTDLQSAQFQLSQLSQTSNIVNQLMPTPKPAYLTCSPYAASLGFVPSYGTCGCNTCA